MSVTPLTGWPSLTVEFAPRYSPLDTTLEWRDISSDVRWGFDTHRGKTTELDQIQPGSASFVLNNRARKYDPEYTSSPWYATYMTAPGTDGAYVSTPHTAALAITGDIEVRIRCALTDWTPSAQNVLISKWDAAPNRGWELFVHTDGTLRFGLSTTGSDFVNNISTVAPTVSDGATLWIRVTLDVNDGAGNRVTKFYTSTDDTNDHTQVTWTQLGSTVTTAGTTSIFNNSTVALTVGGRTEAGVPPAGKVYAAAVLNSIGGTVVADSDLTIGWGAGASSKTDDDGLVYTVQGTASLTADTARGSYVAPRVPIRIKALYSAVTYNVWRGHVSSWEPGYTKRFDAIMTARCQDLMTVMAQVPTGGGAWRSKVESLSPRAWWRFSDAASAAIPSTARDVGGLYDGFYTGTTPTMTAGIIDADDNLALSTGTNGFVVLPSNAGTVFNTASGFYPPATIVCWFSVASVGAADKTICSMLFNDGSEVHIYVDQGTSGQVQVSEHGAATHATAGTYADGRPHMVAFNPQILLNGYHRLTVDTETVDSNTIYGVTSTCTGLWAGVRYDGTLLFADGVLDEMVIFDRNLTNTEIADLYQAGYASWSGEGTGTRAARAATVAAIPSALQSIETGDSTCEDWTGGTNTLAVAQAADLTEQGILYVSGDGKLTFKARSTLRNTTSAFTATESHIKDYDSDYGEAQIINYADLTSTAGTGSASDTTSIRRYGRAGVSRTTIDSNRNNLVGGAQNLVAKYKDPKQRVTGLTFKPMTLPATLWPQALGREIGDRITFTRTPMGLGASISQELLIVGIDHTVTEDGWETRWNCSQADTLNYFALDDANRGLDSTAILAAF